MRAGSTPLSLSSFFKQLKSCLPSKNSNVVIACGNESADMDSVASTISYSYLDYLCTKPVDAQKDVNIKSVFPIINIPKKDLSLRKDIVFVLNKLGLSSNDLFFKEDLIHFKEIQNCSINAVLVDHNEISHGTLPYIDNVIGILDHHVDSNKYLDVKFRDIQMTGSCSSLVFDFWYNKVVDKEQFVSLTKEVAYLSLAAALQDTSNFKSKVKPLDMACLSLYEKILPTISLVNFHSNLNTAKTDISGLSVADILKKDYKEWIMKRKDDSNRVVVGIASIVKPFHWLFDKNGVDQTTFIEESKQYIIDKSLDILVLMTSCKEEKNEFRRQLGIVYNDSSKNDLIMNLINEIKDTLQLVPFADYPSIDNYIPFNQLNTKASRKQVAPCIQEAISKL